MRMVSLHHPPSPSPPSQATHPPPCFVSPVCRLSVDRSLGRQRSGSASSAVGQSSSSSSRGAGFAAALVGVVSQAVGRGEEEPRSTSTDRGSGTGSPCEDGEQVLAMDMFAQNGSLPRMIAAVSAPQVGTGPLAS